MFSWYKYLIVSLVFSHLGFWSGNLFLIASFPDLCLLVTFRKIVIKQTLDPDFISEICYFKFVQEKKLIDLMAFRVNVNYTAFNSRETIPLLTSKCVWS